MRPGVGDTSWSTDTTSPTLGGDAPCFDQFFAVFERHGRLVAFAYLQALQIGTLHFANLGDKMPCRAISCNFGNGACPKSW